MSSEVYIFAYVFMPLTVCTCVRVGCMPRLCCHGLLHCRRPAKPVFRPCWPVCYRMTRSHMTATVFKLGARLLDTSQSHMLLNKDQQCCESWRDIKLRVCARCAVGDRLTKTIESICCAVRHTVTLLRAVWWTIHLPHSVRVLIATMTDAGHHWPSAAHPTTPTICSVSVVNYAVVTMHLLFSTCCSLLATSFWWHSWFYTMLQTPFFPIVPLSIFVDTVLSHNYHITPVIKVIFWFQSCLLIIPRFPHRLTAE